MTKIYIGKLFECVAPCYNSSTGVWNNGTKHIFAGSVRVASKPISTTEDIFYFHPNHLGSTSVITDKNGANYAEFAYLPFGDSYPADNQASHYKYTGQERDPETSLYFYNARYYDARIGKFTQADTIVPYPADPQAFNRYSYVRNNPINLIDPTGRRWGTLDRIADRGRKAVKNQVDALQENPKVTGAVLITAGVVLMGAEVVAEGACAGYCVRAGVVLVGNGVDIYNNEPARGGSIGASTSGGGQFDIWTGTPSTNGGDVFGNRATVASITVGGSGSVALVSPGTTLSIISIQVASVGPNPFALPEECVLSCGNMLFSVSHFLGGPLMRAWNQNPFTVSMHILAAEVINSNAPEYKNQLGRPGLLPASVIGPASATILPNQISRIGFTGYPSNRFYFWVRIYGISRDSEGREQKELIGEGRVPGLVPPDAAGYPP